MRAHNALTAASISASYTIRKKAYGPVHCGPSRGPPRHSAEPGHHTRQAQRLRRQGRARARRVDRLPHLRLQRPSTRRGIEVMELFEVSRLWNYSLTPLAVAIGMMNPIDSGTHDTSLCAAIYWFYHGYRHCKRSSANNVTRAFSCRAQAEHQGGRARPRAVPA